MKSRRLTTAALGFALALFVFWVFSPALSHGFLLFDDDRYITSNPAVGMGLSQGFLQRAFATNLLGNWQPLTFLSHALDVQLWGLNPMGHHLGNILIHCLNTVLLFALALRLGATRSLALLASLLFAFHPLRVESVAWISERKDVLCMLFFLLALHAHVSFARSGSWRDGFLVFAAMLAGLLAKPMIVTLPFVLLILDWWPLGRMDSLRTATARILEKLPLFALSALFCVVAIHFQGDSGAVRYLQELPLSIRLQTAPVAVCACLWNSIAPTDLSPYYNHPGTWPWWLVATCATVILSISIATLAIRNSRPWWAAGWVFFLGTLVPVIGLVQVGDQWMADRYTYIPMLGPLAAVVVEFGQPRSRRFWKPLCMAAAVIAVCLLTIATRRQLPVWRDSGALADAAIAHDGGHWSMRTNKAIHLASTNKAESLELFRRIQADFPADSDSGNNLGFALLTSNRPSEAVSILQQVVRLHPGFYTKIY